MLTEKKGLVGSTLARKGLEYQTVQNPREVVQAKRPSEDDVAQPAKRSRGRPRKLSSASSLKSRNLKK